MSIKISLDKEQRETLLKIARGAIKRKLGLESTGFDLKDEIFNEKCGLFVTIYKNKELRGCIGNITSDTALSVLTDEMAVYAAFKDSRFPSLSKAEYEDIQIKISVLTPPHKADFDDIVLGRDGVVLRKKGKSSVFLPNVPIEQGWTKIDMMENLSIKAGLKKDAWIEGAQFEIFQSIEFGED